MRVIPPPRPGPRAGPAALAARRPCSPSPPLSSSRPAGPGLARSDDLPNTIRCKTARSVRSRSSSAACSAFSSRSRAFSSRSSLASRASSWFASSAAASTSGSDASASSRSGTAPAATATQHSKHAHQPQITHHAQRVARQPARPRHTTSEYLRGGKPQAFWCQSPRTIKPPRFPSSRSSPRKASRIRARDKPGRVKQVTPQLSSSCGMVKWVSPHFLPR